MMCGFRQQAVKHQPRSQALAQLPIACSMVKRTASDGKLGEGLGMRLVKHHHMLHAIHSKQNSDNKGQRN